MFGRQTITYVLILPALAGLAGCGSANTPLPSDRDAAGVRARIHEGYADGWAKHYAAACALDTKAYQDRLMAELKVSSCVAADVKLAEPLPRIAGWSAARQAAVEAEGRTSTEAEIPKREISVAGDRAHVTDPDIGWTEEYVYTGGQWLLVTQNTKGQTYESERQQFLAEGNHRVADGHKEAAEHRAAAARAATQERAAKAEQAAQQRQKAKEVAATRAREDVKTNEQAAAKNAKQLVEVWKEEPIEASNENVLSIQGHLISLGSKCEQSIPSLANNIYATVEILKKADISDTPVEIAAAFDTAAPGKKVTAECKSILSALTVLIEKGES